MTPGFCGFFEKPDWVDEAEPPEYCEAVPTDDGACFVDTERPWKSWIETDLTIPLGDAR